ncbi:MAG: TRAP transporter large permease subunit, partial [Porticoccaceae bacterium]
MAEFIPFLMFLTVCLVLMAGYPVALSLAGTALLFALVGAAAGQFDMAFLLALPNRLFGTIENTTLIAVPLFVFMGVMLEKSRLSEDLLESMADLFGGFRSGLG